MTTLDKYAEALSTEMMGEAATNFFGARVDVENRIKRLQEMASEVNEVKDFVVDQAALLRLCMLEDKNIEALCQNLGCAPALCANLTTIFFDTSIDIKKGKTAIPFGLTESSRFRRLTFKAYETFYHALKEYGHGKHIDDHNHPGKKILTVNYSLLTELSEYINNSIDKINKEAPAGEVLHHIKGICAAGDKKSDICGGFDPQFCSTLDKSLEMEHFDFDTLNVIELPLLPAPDDAKEAIYSFCKDLYKRNKREVHHSLKSL